MHICAGVRNSNRRNLLKNMLMEGRVGKGDMFQCIKDTFRAGLGINGVVVSGDQISLRRKR
jgi:hypothetical protein